jgi:hypothetical protein
MESRPDKNAAHLRGARKPQAVEMLDCVVPDDRMVQGFVAAPIRR